MTDQAPRSWVVSRAAHVLLTLTLVMGTLGLSLVAVKKATEVRRPDSTFVLNQATLRLLNTMDVSITNFTSRYSHCATPACSAPFARLYANRLNSSIDEFRSTYLFPLSTRVAAVHLASSVALVVGDLRRIGSATSSLEQYQVVHEKVVADLFTALRFGHEILFSHQVHSTPSVRQLLDAMSTLVTSYSREVTNFNAAQSVCAPTSCHAHLAAIATSRINALATAFEANYVFPHDELALQTAFAFSVHQIASDVSEAFVNESNFPLSHQITTFRVLTHRDIARVVASQRALARALTTRG